MNPASSGTMMIIAVDKYARQMTSNARQASLSMVTAIVINPWRSQKFSRRKAIPLPEIFIASKMINFGEV